MKIILISLTFFVLPSQLLTDTFDHWKINNNILFKNFTLDSIKREIFEANKIKVFAHNENILNTFKLQLNKFAAHSVEEFILERCGAKRKLATTNFNPFNFFSMLKTVRTIRGTEKSRKSFSLDSSKSTPATLNNTRYTLPILDQGQCGSCWAFASMSVIESKLMIKDNSYNTSLSPQYLMDCDIKDMALDGQQLLLVKWGYLQTNALFLKYLGGGNNAPSVQSYPYKAAQTPACLSSLFMPTISLGITDVIENDLNGNETALQALVANEGSVGVAVDATHYFQLYSSGVLDDKTADNTCTSVNHAVVLVGYGTDSLYGDYWLVKNSWGADWGENGMVRVARNKNNSINIACFIYYVHL
ncbi:hypothetical protein PVAND_004223 [Polypedilum vanderplanki]|uniref:Uncharacterized protein n=1 Tax=Polypedilum vanderplanki TaxID=319348 RepID=A0A9J6BXH0_POLVA|nr:hypothetical protein PVAND_004223 [Polypedilum vanderplanki]